MKKAKPVALPTPDEEEGITMIQYLQSLAGITETRERALNGWRHMSPSERSQTRSAFRMLGGAVPTRN